MTCIVVSVQLVLEDDLQRWMLIYTHIICWFMVVFAGAALSLCRFSLSSSCSDIVILVHCRVEYLKMNLIIMISDTMPDLSTTFVILNMVIVLYPLVVR
jgi:hypothetical protein